MLTGQVWEVLSVCRMHHIFVVFDEWENVSLPLFDCTVPDGTQQLWSIVHKTVYSEMTRFVFHQRTAERSHPEIHPIIAISPKESRRATHVGSFFGKI